MPENARVSIELRWCLCVDFSFYMLHAIVLIKDIHAGCAISSHLHQSVMLLSSRAHTHGVKKAEASSPAEHGDRELVLCAAHRWSELLTVVICVRYNLLKTITLYFHYRWWLPNTGDLGTAALRLGDASAVLKLMSALNNCLYEVVSS